MQTLYDRWKKIELESQGGVMKGIPRGGRSGRSRKALAARSEKRPEKKRGQFQHHSGERS